MNAKHTPGPLRVVTNKAGIPLVVADTGKYWEKEQQIAGYSGPNAEGNAQLGAAAPDLLEAAEAAVKGWEHPTVESIKMRCDATLLLRAAIAKARGE